MTALVPESIRIQQINDRKNITFLKWDGGYSGNKSKAILSCDKCSFKWCAKVNNILSSNSGCPSCSKRRVWSSAERIKQINKIENVEFVRWPEKYDGVESKVTVKCLKDGFEWNVRVGNLVNNGTGCPKCKSLSISKIRRTNRDDLELQIMIAGKSRYEFVKWEDDNNAQFRAKAVLRCLGDGFEWKSTVSNLIGGKTGCPKCSKTGYDPSKTGTLYALRSECGRYVKVGISNKPEQRHEELRRSTPFEFIAIEQIEGGGKLIAALEKSFHSRHESAWLSGFNGATEWLLCTDELLQELRNARDSLNQDV